MSDIINLPTKSEINGNKENENEVITLNIYNNYNDYKDTIDNINQTEEKLYIKDNYNNLIKPNNNIIYYDNVREKPNNHPISENRGIKSTIPFNKNKYSKSVNPYEINDNLKINNKLYTNNNNSNKTNKNYIKNEGTKRPIIYRPKKKEPIIYHSRPKHEYDKCIIICCLGTFLFFLFPPIGILYCWCKCSKERK